MAYLTWSMHLHCILQLAWSAHLPGISALDSGVARPSCGDRSWARALPASSRRTFPPHIACVVAVGPRRPSGRPTGTRGEPTYPVLCIITHGFGVSPRVGILCVHGRLQLASSLSVFAAAPAIPAVKNSQAAPFRCLSRGVTCCDFGAMDLLAIPHHMLMLFSVRVPALSWQATTRLRRCAGYQWHVEPTEHEQVLLRAAADRAAGPPAAAPSLLAGREAWHRRAEAVFEQATLSLLATQTLKRERAKGSPATVRPTAPVIPGHPITGLLIGVVPGWQAGVLSEGAWLASVTTK